jgi:hypothetical protein
MGRLKDPQVKRVYAWEGQHADWMRSTLSLRGTRAVVKWACDKYGLPCPIIRQHYHTDDSYSQADGAPGGRPLISFRAADQKNPAVALHEAAHYIHDAIFGDKGVHHSTEWLGVYLWLLEGYRIAPRTALHASAKAAGLRWVPTWIMSPKRLQRKRGP